MSQFKVSDNKIHSDDTASRILDSAEYLFAENGFFGTSSREITKKAGCNVASINYYFGGKDNLYKHVCKRRLSAIREYRIKRINDYMNQDSASITLEGVLYNFSEAFLAPLLDEASGRYVMKLMIREMLYPQLPANMIYDEMILPMSIALKDSMLKVCPDLKEKQAFWAIFSLVGQLLHTIHVNGMVTNNPDPRFGFDLSEAVDNVVSMTAAGIRAQVKSDGELNNA